MPSRRRLTAVLVLGAIVLALGGMAWPWLRATVVAPLSLVAWLFLRLFVLCVDQHVWWLLLTLAALAAACLALLPRLSSEPERRARQVQVVSHPVEDWRWFIDGAAGGTRASWRFGWDGFVQLFVSFQALQRRVAPDFRVRDALQRGDLPLPARVRAFLFPAARAEPASRLARWTSRIRRALHAWTGRDREERLRSMSEALSFLEDSLEMAHDGERHDRTHD